MTDGTHKLPCRCYVGLVLKSILKCWTIDYVMDDRPLAKFLEKLGPRASAELVVGFMEKLRLRASIVSQ